MASEDGRYQVIVVGGGPVGMALAVELGRRGVCCAVVESREQPEPIPKGQNLTQRTLEHFYFWSCAEALRAARVLPPGYPIGGVVCYGDLTSEYWHAPAGREAVGAYYFQGNERLPQYRTEAVLRERARAIPEVTTLFGWSAIGVRADDRSARVTVARDAEARERVLEADYVVGCDGARSLVRDRLGISRSGPALSRQMVLAVFRSRELHERLGRFPERTTYRVLHPALDGYWRFFGRVDAEGSFFFHAPLPPGASPENPDIREVLYEAAGFPFACEFDHVGFWGLRIEVARTYRRGRGFIAGDACHSHPPYGGYGLNTGLEDAVNLGWKLAATLQGAGGERLLDSYSAERQPVFAETGDDVIAAMIRRDSAFLRRYNPGKDRAEFEHAWATQMANADTGPAWYAPHYEGSPVVPGPPGGRCGVRGGHSFLARPGHHLAPQLLSGGRNVFEALGSGFTLLAFGDTGQGATRARDRAHALGIPLTVAEDSYAEGRRAYGSPFILVRPDQYVAWAGNELPADLPGLLARCAGAN